MTTATERVARMAKGIHLQVYLDAIHASPGGSKLGALVAIASRWKAAGGVGIVLHDPGAPAHVRDLARPLAALGLQVSAAHGLGQRDSHNPAAAAARVAAVAAMPEIDGATLIDAETALRDEVSDLAAAHAFMVALRAAAPDALLVLQSVPALQTRSHDLDNFGFRKPDTMRFFDAVAPMAYRNYAPYWSGRADIIPRWWELMARAAADLGVVPAGAPNPWADWVTYQAYRWQGIGHKLVDTLLRSPGGVVFAWAEPEPDATWYAGLAAVAALAARGFRGPGAVRAFQVAHSVATPCAPLDPDGWCGPATRAALGLPAAP